MHKFTTPNRNRNLGYEVSSFDQFFICADCEGDDILNLQYLGFHRQRCKLDQCNFQKVPWETWTSKIPYHIRRNHRPYLTKNELVIRFKYGYDRLFCEACNTIGCNFGFTPVGLFNHMRDSCGSLDPLIRNASNLWRGRKQRDEQWQKHGSNQ